MANYIAKLDTSQRKAVAHNQGPLLVLAGAGSGKTRVLTNRIARLVDERICASDNILALTFTNKAANEMSERMAKLVSKTRVKKMTICTFHSLGVKILREFGEKLGLHPGFSILGENERINIIKQIMRATNKTISKENPAEYGFQISLAKNAGLVPKTFKQANPEERKGYRVFNSYEKIIHHQNKVDFDDLLLKPLNLFSQFPTILEHYRKQYTFISVDEFQDTNKVQLELTKLIAAPQDNVMAVGDDDQGIYSWRGADIDNIIFFTSQFKKCTTVVLQHNYRSTRQIVEGALGVVSRNQKRKIKKVSSARGDGPLIATFKANNEEDEAKWLVEEIIENKKKGIPLRNHAILLRTNALMRRFEEELRINRVAYTIYGAMSFFDRKEIMDVFAYLRFFANTQDELSLMRVLKVPNKGITPSTLEKLEDLAGTRRISLWQAFNQYKHAAMIPDIQKERIEHFINFFNRYHGQFKKGTLADTCRKMLHECGYFETLQRAYKNDKSLTIRLENIDELIHALELYGKKHRQKKEHILSSFVQDYTMLMGDNQDEGKNNKNSVALMTLHKSKGLEFPIVFMPVLDDTVIPSAKACAQGNIEEERRLFYVGMTRSQKQLYLSCAKEKLFRNNYKTIKPSRFIFEIPEEFIDGKFGEREDEENQKICADLFAELKNRFKPTE